MAGVNRRGPTRRVRPAPVALIFSTLILTLGWPPPAADAHGGGAPARPVVRAVEPSTAGIRAAAVFVGDWRIELTSTSRETVAVLDPAGRPFLRFTPGGVEADYGARAWHEGNVSAVPGRVVSSHVTPDSLVLLDELGAVQAVEQRISSFRRSPTTPGWRASTSCRGAVGRYSSPSRLCQVTSRLTAPDLRMRSPTT